MGALDVLNIGVRMRTIHGDGAPLGPLAIVIPADKYPLLSRVLGILATPRRPMRLFTEVDRARKWLVARARCGDQQPRHHAVAGGAEACRNCR